MRTTPPVTTDQSAEVSLTPNSTGEKTEQKSLKKNAPPVTLQTSPDFKNDVSAASTKQEAVSQSAEPVLGSKDREKKESPAKEVLEERNVVTTGATSDNKNSERDEYRVEASKKNVPEKSLSGENQGFASNAREKKAENFSTGGGVLDMSSADSIYESFLESGIKEYDSKNYPAAVVALDSALQIEPSFYEALFYRGISHLGLNEPDVAIKDLEGVLKGPQNKFSDPAKWYLSLAYLKKNKLAKAKKLLEDLSAGESEYKSSAKKALDDLK